jgi:hypothetical protein
MNYMILNNIVNLVFFKKAFLSEVHAWEGHEDKWCSLCITVPL